MPALRLIHRTAIIDPKAWIDSGVVIGPYALIEGSVEISSGTEIQGRAVIVGSVQIGKDNRIGHGTVIGSFPQDLSFNPTANSGVKIGGDNVIHEFCTIHRGTKEGSNTFVGSNNLLMAGAHLGHNTLLGNNITLENNVLLGGYAEIDDQAFIGAGSVVHQFTRVGAIRLARRTSRRGVERDHHGGRNRATDNGDSDPPARADAGRPSGSRDRPQRHLVGIVRNRP